MPDLTPIRVRGKRSAAPVEKWHAGKKRKHLQQNPTSSTPTTSRPSSAVPVRKRKQNVELSRLEQLPAEIVQEIFVISGNTNLPLTCKSLMDQLSSRHLHVTLTSSVMECLKSEHPAPTPVEILAARRLLNCNFMTWNFWKAWLDETFPSSEPDEDYTSLTARRLSHLPGLPPRKLLTGPWTPDQIAFLRATSRPGFSILNESFVDGELAYEGLEQAVAEGALEAINLIFQKLGLKTTTALLRKAVVDYDCNKEIVISLLDQGGPELNLLEPTLWSWAEKTDRRGNEKGSWLIKQLRQRAQADGTE